MPLAEERGALVVVFLFDVLNMCTFDDRAKVLLFARLAMGFMTSNFIEI